MVALDADVSTRSPGGRSIDHAHAFRVLERRDYSIVQFDELPGEMLMQTFICEFEWETRCYYGEPREEV